jgi:Alginate lyase
MTSRRGYPGLVVVLALAALLGVSCSREEQERAEPRATVAEPVSTVTETVEERPPHQARRSRNGIWISRAELMRLPTTGPAWERLTEAADEELGEADIADQDSNHDVHTLAVALVYARTGDSGYRTKAADAITGAIGTEDEGRTLELGRNLFSYVIAADLIDFRAYDPAREAEFRDWLRAVRNEPLGSDGTRGTLIRTHERSPSNWGGMAGASRVAVAAYLGDDRDLARAATVMKGWLGDRSAYPGIPGPRFGPEDVGKGHDFGGHEDDLSWHADPSRPRGVNPRGATKDGHSIDGALPDDMRRGGEFTWPPRYTQYPREALTGYVALAEVLHRQGYNVYAWEDKALLRATVFLYALERRFPEEEWWEPDIPVYRIINFRYGTSFPVEGSGFGRNFGWTGWTHAEERAGA